MPLPGLDQAAARAEAVQPGERVALDVTRELAADQSDVAAERPPAILRRWHELAEPKPQVTGVLRNEGRERLVVQVDWPDFLEGDPQIHRELSVEVVPESRN